jgi:hypothetical protein
MKSWQLAHTMWWVFDANSVARQSLFQSGIAVGLWLPDGHLHFHHMRDPDDATLVRYSVDLASIDSPDIPDAGAGKPVPGSAR